MTVTRGAARRALRELLGEPDEARTFTDNELDRWIAEGCKDIAKQCEVLQSTATITIDSGTQQYDASEDMIRCTRADFVADSDTRTRVLEYRDRLTDGYTMPLTVEDITP